MDDAKALVAAVQEMARLHNGSWEAMVPSSFVVNVAAEAAEDAAYADMAEAKRLLRAHICEVYGISIEDLANLAAA